MVTDEVLIHIFGYLDYQDLTKCCFVCHKWNQVAQDGRLWENLFRKCWKISYGLGKRKRSDCTTDLDRLPTASSDRLAISWKERYKTEINWTNGNYSFKRLKLSKTNVVASICNKFVFYLENKTIKVCDMHGRLCSSFEVELFTDSNTTTDGFLNVLNHNDKHKFLISVFQYKCSTHDYLICISSTSCIMLLTYCSWTSKIVAMCPVVKTNEFTDLFAFSNGILACRFKFHIEIFFISKNCVLVPLHSLSTRYPSASSPIHIAISRSCFGSFFVCVSLVFVKPLISDGSCVCLQELHFNTKTHKLHTCRQASNIVEYISAITTDTTVVISYRLHHLILAFGSNNLITHFRVKSTRKALTIEPGQLLYGHTNAISHIDILPTGKAISVSRNGMEIQRWDLHFARLDSTVPVQITPQDYSQAVTCLSLNNQQLCLEVLKDCLQSFIVYDFSCPGK